MNNNCRRAIQAAILTLAVLTVQAVAAECNADARVTKSWIEEGGFVQKANVAVKINSARPGAIARVYVDLAFEYVTASGQSNIETTTKEVDVDTKNTSSAEDVADVRAVLCIAQMGPCKLRNVSVRRLRCSDV